jgi:hypothetical protein
VTKIKILPIVTLLIAATASWAADEDEMVAKPSFSASQSMSITAVIEAIDHKSRVVTVRKPDGEALTFTVSDEAQNLDQVDIGDTLIAHYKETFSVVVMENDGMKADEAEASAMTRTEKGGMPGFAAMDARVTTATVEEINLERNTFKLKGPDGKVSEYVARNPRNLKLAAVGDLVVITVTESVVVTVESQPAQ